MPPPVPPSPTPLQPIVPAWLGFTKSVSQLLVVRPDDRPLDQYLEFRDEALSIVQGEEFLTELGQAWITFTDYPRTGVGKVLLLELNAFPRAMEVATTAAATETEKTGWLKRLLGRAGTVAGSVDDVLAGLPDWAKAALKLFREAIDLFKGKD